jgi:hypothetical protein
MTIHIIELLYLPEPVIVSGAVHLPNILRKLMSRCWQTGEVESRRGRALRHVARRGEAYGSGGVQVEDSERAEFSRTVDGLYVRARCHLSTVL